MSKCWERLVSRESPLHLPFWAREGWVLHCHCLVVPVYPHCCLLLWSFVVIPCLLFIVVIVPYSSVIIIIVPCLLFVVAIVPCLSFVVIIVPFSLFVIIVVPYLLFIVVILPCSSFIVIVPCCPHLQTPAPTVHPMRLGVGAVLVFICHHCHSIIHHMSRGSQWWYWGRLHHCHICRTQKQMKKLVRYVLKQATRTFTWGPNDISSFGPCSPLLRLEVVSMEGEEWLVAI